MIRYFYAAKKREEEKYLRSNVSRYGKTITLSQTTVDYCMQFSDIKRAEEAVDNYVNTHKTVKKEDLEICKFKLEITKEN